MWSISHQGPNPSPNCLPSQFLAWTAILQDHTDAAAFTRKPYLLKCHLKFPFFHGPWNYQRNPVTFQNSKNSDIFHGERCYVHMFNGLMKNCKFPMPKHVRRACQRHVNGMSTACQRHVNQTTNYEQNTNGDAAASNPKNLPIVRKTKCQKKQSELFNCFSIVFLQRIDNMFEPKSPPGGPIDIVRCVLYTLLVWIHIWHCRHFLPLMRTLEIDSKKWRPTNYKLTYHRQDHVQALEP